jgi:5-methylcytosine-specific restriction endonuclease McrA
MGSNEMSKMTLSGIFDAALDIAERRAKLTQLLKRAIQANDTGLIYRIAGKLACRRDKNESAVWDISSKLVSLDNRKPLKVLRLVSYEPACKQPPQESIEQISPVTFKPGIGKRPGNWGTLRNKVWKRDGAYCQVCLIGISKDLYECGHIIDRYVGGPDTLDNLTVMCIWCNQSKPTHRTREEYDEWRIEQYNLLQASINYHAEFHRSLMEQI